MTQYFMAVDLGTSFIKAGIYDPQGRCVTAAEAKTAAQRVGAGGFIQSGDMLLAAVLKCMRRSAQGLGAPGRIAAVAFTGQMAGVIGTDENWKDITSWSCSLDTRYLPWAKAMAEIYRGHAGEISGTCAPLMAPKIAWLREEFPEEAAKVSKYMLLSSYILGRLGGQKAEGAVIDDSLIGWTGLADLCARQWSGELCRLFDIDRELLPRIVSSDTVCGYLTEEAAGETGLFPGTPLVIGAGDKVAGCIGAGIRKPGDMVFEAGSYGGFSCVVEDYRRNRTRNYYDGICCPEGFLAHKYIPGSGMALGWFLEQFGGSDSFEEMEKKAACLEIGCGGLMAIGLLGGSAMPFDSSLKGMWMGFDLSHRTEHFYRALLESYSYDLALTIDSVEEAYPELEPQGLTMTGGGAKSALWAQMIADVTGKTVYRRRSNDASLRGAALLAQRGVGAAGWNAGAAPDFREETGMVHIPDQNAHVRYQRYKERYEYCRSGLHEYFERLS